MLSRLIILSLSAVLLATVVGGCGGQMGSAGSSGSATASALAEGKMVLEDLHVMVISDQTPAYEIHAKLGVWDESSWIMKMEEPDITVYDAEGHFKQKFDSREGSFWPVTIVRPDSLGLLKEITKYDWSLTKEVVFKSAQGYELKSGMSRFDSDSSELSYSKGVEYRMPTGRGLILEGTADNFIARIDRETGEIKSWKLVGQVVLSSADTEVGEP